jgi:hypothetical protein
MITTLEHPTNQSSASKQSAEFSILICTYNPEKEVFSKALNSVMALVIPTGVQIECIIVDNNSQIPVSQLDYVQSFLQTCPWARIIRETRQGLGFARIAGISHSSAETVVFVDTDNAISPNYLQTLSTFLAQYPHIAAVGPGNIDVEFLGDVPDWFANSFRGSFQERRATVIEYACIPATWLNCYPIGTGLVIRKSVCVEYYSLFQRGEISALGRTGNNLSSGDDVQIVWQAIKMGYAVGISPELCVKHIIPQDRASLEYIKRLSFGIATAYEPALVESFPEAIAQISSPNPSNLQILRRINRIFWHKTRCRQYQTLNIDIARYLGEIVGHARATQQPIPEIVSLLIRTLKLQ